MSTQSKVDPNTLGWVKHEIDETLKQARLALEAFAESPADTTRLRFCATHLHQVVGTLLMVELDGAAMLARETEALVDDLVNEKIKSSGAVLDALTRGMLVLPDYLARLQAGQSDVPYRHLKLMNELRAVRGVEPIAEADLFYPDLSVKPPEAGDAGTKLAESEFQALVRQRRPAYQSALLEWLRGGASPDALARIGDVLAELQDKCAFSAVEQVLWTAGGYVEALRDGGLEVTNDRKKLFARLDQQIKRMIDGSDRSVVRSNAEALSKSMLFEVGHATSNGQRVSQLKHAFGLSALLSAAPPADVASLDLPTPEVLESVSNALRTEITAAQELLSAYFDPDRPESAAIEQLVAQLQKMSSTLEMLGVPILKALVDELLKVCRALIERRIDHPKDASMPMAQALLLVESSARDIHQSADKWKQQIEGSINTLHALHAAEAGTLDTSGIEVSDAELTETEYKQLLSVVAGEVSVNLSKIEEALESFAANNTRYEYLDEVPQYLSQIEGALQILGVERAGELAAATRAHVESLCRREIAADGTVLDGLAVCVGTIGAYVDGLHAGRKNLDVLVDAALKEMDAALAEAGASAPEPVAFDEAVPSDPAGLLAAIRTKLDAWGADHDDRPALESLYRYLTDLGRFARTSGSNRLERITSEMNNVLHLVTANPETLSDNIVSTLDASYQALAQLVESELLTPAAEPPLVEPATDDTFDQPIPDEEAAIAAPTSAPVTPPPEAVPLHQVPVLETPEIDEEILEIFIEDSRDVLETVHREFANWQADPNNTQALAEVRRGYHTLKGSGRMVGANDIGELAWSVENVLNKVRDGKLAPSAEVFALIEETLALVPKMVDQLTGGPAVAVDLDAIRRRAEAVAQGKRAGGAATPKAASAASRQVVETEEEFTDDNLPRLDKTLLEIFTNEAQSHLATVDSELEACHAAGEVCLVSDSLFRAIHTLAGNARSLNLAAMSHACAEGERLLNMLKSQELPLEKSPLDLFASLRAVVAELVDALNSDMTDGGSINAKFEALTVDFHDAAAAVGRSAARTSTAPTHSKSAVPAPVPAAKPAATRKAAPPPVREEKAKPAPVPAPAAKPAAPPPAPLAETQVDEVIDPELMEIFNEEAVDILATIEESLAEWRGKPDNHSVLQDLKRALHTLKGGARMAGSMTMGNLSHATESLVRLIEEGTVKQSGDVFDLLEEAHDMLVTMLDRIKGGQPVPSAENLNARLAALSGGTPVPATNPPAPPATPAMPADAAGLDVQVPDDEWMLDASLDVEPPEAPAAPSSRVEPAPVPVARSQPVLFERSEEGEDTDDAASAFVRSPDRGGLIRVRTALLNDLVNYAGEVSIARARMEQQIYGFRDNLAELTRNVTRFRDQIRDLEIQSESQILYRMEQAQAAGTPDFDPLELDRFTKLQQLSRQLAESLHDLSTIQNNMGNFVGEAETVLQQQARLNTDLQEGLMRTRMVSFLTQAGRLRHIVRQTARELGKRVDLDITGSEVELDRTVLERMIGPFEHMIRNAIDHGIESEADRRRRGKSPTGRITLKTAQEGSEIVLTFSDDGAGLNTKAIRTKAIERGLIGEDANLGEEELIQFILMSGFSTASKITHVSGRGVGMDVVHNEVKQLGGTMSVDSVAGQGTTFVIRLPLTLSIAQALMVYVSDQLYAVPLSSVANIIEYPVDKLEKLSVGKNPLLNVEEQVYPYMNLAQRLGLPTGARNGRKTPVLLARAGNREVAIKVDGLGGTREIVIKSLGPQLTAMKGLAGATIQGDGSVILILDLPGLWYSDDAMHLEHRAAARLEPMETTAPAAPTPAPAPQRPVIMVVDDSLTVRKVTGKHLQKRGMEVLTAKDGLDAWDQLRERLPQVMLVDIEMPRMDGYELTSRIRADERLKHIPIIMITSRAGAKHRQRAFQLGVDMYMGKPYQEDELFNNIDTLLASGRPH